MAIPSSLDAHAQAHHYSGQVYRLALLVTGNRDLATDLTATVCASISLQHAPDGDTELALARALLQQQMHRRQRAARWTWRADVEALNRAGLTSAEATVLFKLLAASSPATRLLLGLHLLWGLTPTEAAAALNVAPTAVYEVQAAAAHALGYVPSEADPGVTQQIARLLGGDLPAEEALAVRGQILGDEHARTLRDGVLRVERTLQEAIPALFAATPPQELGTRIEQAIVLNVPVTQPRAAHPLQQHPRLVLTAVVLLLIGSMLALPTVRQQLRTTTVASPTASSSSPGALVEAAIHRLDRPLLQQDVLHEVYESTLNGRMWTLERWYDYNAPHRLSVTLRENGSDAIVYGVATDGQDSVQYRSRPGNQRGGQAIDLNITLPTKEVETLLPILRQQPDATFFNARGLPDLSRFYLAQAHAALPIALGATTVAGRDAQIVAFDTNQPAPSFGRQQQASSPSRVLLTIDTATASLLDVTVLPNGEGENTALHPWRVTQFELRKEAPEAAFSLPGANENQRTSLPNPRAPAFFDNSLLTLQEALGRQQQPLYVPQDLPDSAMRSLALSFGTGDPGVALVYEGEFSSVLVSPSSLIRPRETIDGPRYTAGDFSYQLSSVDLSATTPISAALVSRTDDPDNTTHVYLLDQYATPQEREAELQKVISSLQPVTTANVDALNRAFYQPVAQGQ